jgi:TonB-linked SusC/RagA family outer membrane protein
MNFFVSRHAHARTQSMTAKLLQVMKLSAMLLLLTALHVSARTSSQVISYSGKNVSLVTVFKEIRKQTGYLVVYKKSQLVNIATTTVEVKNMPLAGFLDQLLKGKDLKYSIESKTIIIAEKTVSGNVTGLRLEAGIAAVIPPVPIQVRVIDSAGTPLAGAFVSLKNSKISGVTDAEGILTINVNEGDLLLFSSVGMGSRAITITEAIISNTTLTVVLQPAVAKLEEVNVVSTGYQTLSKERSTGSFERIGERTLDRKISQNIFSKLEGEVAGLTTDASGKFIVRGLSSIKANTDPLVVVDGFPVEQGANTINPNDVESITILKDAAAASIWGIRATNGVIVITTKKGTRTSRLNVNASVNMALTPKPDLAAAPLGDPATQVAYQQALYKSGGFYKLSDLFSGNLTASSGRVLNPVGETLLLQARGDISADEAKLRLQRLANTDSRKEYASLIQQAEKWRQYNISVSGGSKNYDFNTSVSYNSNDKEFRGTKAEQYLVKFANSFDLAPKLKVDGSINFSQSKENFPTSSVADGISAIGASSPAYFLSSVPITSRILDDNGNYVPMQSVLSFGAQSSQLALSRGFPYAWTYNMKQELDNTDNVWRETALRLQTGIAYNILKGLDMTMKYQYEWAQQNTRDFHNENTIFTRARVNLFTKLGTNGIAIDNNIPVGSILDTDLRNQRSHTLRTQLNFDRSFDRGKHQVAAIAGYEVRKTLYDRATDRKYGFNEQSLSSVRPDFRTSFPPSIPLTNISVIPANSVNEFVENRFISYYTNAAYTFDNRYTISASTRLDDTNLFGSSDKYKNIPLYSLGLKWNIKNDLLRSNETIDALQLRATYGTNGNVDRSTSPYLQAKVKRGYPPYTGYNADIISVPNPELRLEKTRTLNLGTDFSLWNHLVGGSVEYYIKDSRDLLALTTLNPTLGISGALINNGSLRNEGFDINLRFKLVDKAKFTYTTTTIFSVNTNTLKKVDVPNKQISDYVTGTVAEAGAALRTIYSYNYKGLDANGMPQFINEEGKVIDSKTYINSTNALVKNGSLVPRYYGSWINNIGYKNFFVRTLATFKAGHVFRYSRNNVAYVPTAGTPQVNVPADFNDRWQKPGDENRTDVPAMPAYADMSAIGYLYYRDVAKFVDNAAHIRLSQVNIGYSLDKKWISRLGINSLQIVLQADNLAVWNFNKWDVDPENSFIPLTPTYTLNVSVSF